MTTVGSPAPGQRPCSADRHGHRCWWDLTQARWICATPPAEPLDFGGAVGRLATVG